MPLAVDLGRLSFASGLDLVFDGFVLVLRFFVSNLWWFRFRPAGFEFGVGFGRILATVVPKKESF